MSYKLYSLRNHFISFIFFHSRTMDNVFHLHQILSKTRFLLIFCPIRVYKPFSKRNFMKKSTF